jgi:hypothetical protein
MPAILKRNRTAVPAQDEQSTVSIATLMANVELSVGALRADKVSHREFREFVRDRAHAEHDAWAPIRSERFSRGL